MNRKRSLFQKCWYDLRNVTPVRQMRKMLQIAYRNCQSLNDLNAQSQNLVRLTEAQLDHASRVLGIQCEEFLARHLFTNPKYADPRRLNRFEYQVYS